jgi:excinuclease UvrABC nuclease subunit
MRASRDEIPALLIPDSGQSFKGDDFRMLCKPCVYMFMQDRIPIYIGVSRTGLGRAMHYAHRQAKLARTECDEVRVFPCLTGRKAFRLETMLIAKCQPKYNKRNKHKSLQDMLGLERIGATYPQAEEHSRQH